MIPPGTRISIVNSICVPHDAISASILESARALEAACPGSVTLFGYRCDAPGLRTVVVPRLTALLCEPHFLASDVLLFHFGIWYDLFDAIILGNGRARRFARFHNVTPRELVPEAMRATIDKSLAQIENLAWADHVWCDSEYNRRYLLDYGLAEERVSTLELPVQVPAAPPQPPRMAAAAPVIFAYIGRVVPAKGLRDLVSAVKELRRAGLDGFRVIIAGNADFSDSVFAAELARRVREAGLDDYVTFSGEVSEAEKARLLESAHALVMPSFHEGFCMPVVEALARGCYILGYAAGNTPFITSGFGTLVETGDVAALAAAMERFARAVRERDNPMLDTDGHGRLPLSEFQARAFEYASRFSPSRFRDRFLADFSERFAR